MLLNCCLKVLREGDIIYLLICLFSTTCFEKQRHMRFWVKHTQLLQSTDQVLLKYGSAIIEVISSHELIDRVLVHVNEALQFVEHCILDLF